MQALKLANFVSGSIVLQTNAALSNVFEHRCGVRQREEKGAEISRRYQHRKPRISDGFHEVVAQLHARDALEIDGGKTGAISE